MTADGIAWIILGGLLAYLLTRIALNVIGAIRLYRSGWRPEDDDQNGDDR